MLLLHYNATTHAIRNAKAWIPKNRLERNLSPAANLSSILYGADIVPNRFQIMFFFWGIIIFGEGCCFACLYHPYTRNPNSLNPIPDKPYTLSTLYPINPIPHILFILYPI